MKKILAILSFIEMLTLFACVPQSFVIMTPSLPYHPTPSLTPHATTQYPAVDAWSFDPAEKNDGKISLAISNQNQDCQPLDQEFQINTTFHNLTDNDLTIPGRFQIITNATGVATDITAIIKPVDKDQIYVREESPLEILFKPLPTASAYYKLPAKGTFKTIISYRIRPAFHTGISIFVYDSKKDSAYFLPITPGRYFLKFIYSLWQFNSRTGFNDITASAISNRVEICIK